MRRSRVVIPMRTTLTLTGEWLDAMTDWTRWLHAADRATETIKLRSYHVRVFANTFYGQGPWDATEEDLLEYLANPRWSTATKRSHQASLRVFYGWAHAAGRITENPAAPLPRITEPRGLPNPAPDQVIADAMQVADERVELMIELGAEAGLRRGEICKVHTRDVQLVGNRWKLRVVGKGARVREVPLTSRLARKLRACPPGFAFPGQIDGHLSAHYTGKLISRALADGWTPHKLRHRAGTVWYQATKDLRAVQELLGHASPATTQVYTLLGDESKWDAIEAGSHIA